MSSDNGFAKAVEPILRKFLENIDNPFVWMPLGLFILCVLAYPMTRMRAFPYLAIAFLLVAFLADWVGRWRNRRSPPEPALEEAGYRDDLFQYLAANQAKAVTMMKQGKIAAAQALTKKNLHALDDALKTYPDDADLLSLMGYTMKDLHQTSKGLLPAQERKAYLERGRKSLERALKLEPNNASAHNSMGNILFLEGHFDDAIKEHDLALQLTGGDYPAAKNDRSLVLSVKNGKVTFEHYR